MARDGSTIEPQELFDRLAFVHGVWKGVRAVLVPALLTTHSILDDEQAARWELADAFEDRQGRGRIPEAQKEAQGRRIDRRSRVDAGQDGPHLRPEREALAIVVVVDELDAHRI